MVGILKWKGSFEIFQRFFYFRLNQRTERVQFNVPVLFHIAPYHRLFLSQCVACLSGNFHVGCILFVQFYTTTCFIPLFTIIEDVVTNIIPLSGLIAGRGCDKDGEHLHKIFVLIGGGLVGNKFQCMRFFMGPVGPVGGIMLRGDFLIFRTEFFGLV